MQIAKGLFKDSLLFQVPRDEQIGLCAEPMKFLNAPWQFEIVILQVTVIGHDLNDPVAEVSILTP